MLIKEAHQREIPQRGEGGGGGGRGYNKTISKFQQR
jgi:hypothetical protein